MKLSFFFSLLSLTFLSSVTAIPVSKDLSSKSNSLRGFSLPSIVLTPYGIAEGTQTGTGGVNRYVVKYAAANRWEPSTQSTDWTTPDNSFTALPPACPQPGLNATEYSEDCLYLILYVPPGISFEQTDVFVWIHGGSFYFGAATDPGLDGSALAVATNSIVVTLQYRLGVLGWLPPQTSDENTNLGAKDVVNALKFLHQVLPSFGGNPSSITLAGQSSGAKMVAAMMAAPSALPYFSKAVLHSAVTWNGFLPSSSIPILQNFFFSNISCASGDSNYPSCLNETPLSTLISAQTTLLNDAATLSPASGSDEPLRPTTDSTNFLVSMFPGNFPQPLKPLLITNVHNEAGAAIGAALPAGLSTSYFEPLVLDTFGTNRTDILLNSSFYQLDQFSGDDVLREGLELLGTDATWRCGSWLVSRDYVQQGGNVYTGMFVVGSTYPYNADIDYCTEDGRVCHQDDIMILFGTTSSPTAAQAALTKEVQARWGAFMQSGIPEANGYPSWPATTSSVPNAYLLGGSGLDAIGACEPTFWGEEVEFDYQVYGQ